MSISTIEEAIKTHHDALEIASPEHFIAELIEACDAHAITPKLYAGTLNPMAQARTVLDVSMVGIENVKGVAKRELAILPGVTLLYGVNDAGKSSFLEGLRLALFGARNAEQYIRHGETELRTLVAIDGGTIDRRYKLRKVRGKDETKLEHKLKASLGGAEDDKPGQAQDLINSWIGVDDGFVKRTAIIDQGDLAALLHEQPGKRRELVYSMLGLHAAEETRAKFAAVSRDLAAKAAEAETQLAGFIRTRDDLAKLMKQHPTDKLTREIHELVMKLATLPVVETREVAKTKCAQLASHLDQDKKHREAAKRVAEQIEQLELKGQPIPIPVPSDEEITATATQHGAAAQIVNRLTAQLADVKAKGTALKTMPATCPTCATLGKTCELTPEMKEARRQELLREYKETEAALEKSKLDLKNAIEYGSQLAAGKQHGAERQREIDAYLAQLGELRAHLKAYQAAFLADDVAASMKKEYVELSARADGAADPRGGVQAEIDVRQKALSEAETTDKRHTDAVAAVTATEARVIDLKAQAHTADRIAGVFAKDKLPLFIARQHLARVNAIADELSATDRYRYAFDEDLGIEFLDRDTAAKVSPAVASGSSQQRGALVLTAALGRYLQELAGVTIPLLWIDEIPFQDEANAAVRVVGILKSLTKHFPKVVFAASNWDLYLGQFDHEVAVGTIQTPSGAGKSKRAKGVVMEDLTEARIKRAGLSMNEVTAAQMGVEVPTDSAKMEAIKKMEAELGEPEGVIGDAQTTANYERLTQLTASEEEQLARFAPENVCEPHAKAYGEPAAGDPKACIYCKKAAELGALPRETKVETPNTPNCVACFTGEGAHTATCVSQNVPYFHGPPGVVPVRVLTPKEVVEKYGAPTEDLGQAGLGTATEEDPF